MRPAGGRPDPAGRVLPAHARRACEGIEMRTQYDAVVIGAGHNGLVAASYLARRGLSRGA